jgi:hypothetical protein
MAALVNEVSWSRTRTFAFETCARRYWFQYYLKWNGWDAGAAEERRVAYRLSNMTNLVLLAGEAAHEAVKALLTAVKQGRPWTAEDAETHARGFMNDVWLKAKRRGFLRGSPKWNRPLFELYYGDGPSKEDLARAGEKARRAVRNFATSPFFADLLRTDPAGWFWIDEKGRIDDAAPAVRVDGARVWALPDFARAEGDGCVLYDWKTGAPKADDETQILSYALHARDVWRYPPEKIRAVLVYLGDGVETREATVDAPRLREVEARIRRDVTAMRALHAADPPFDAFATVEDRAVCAECFFKELCPAVRETPAHLRDAAATDG